MTVLGAADRHGQGDAAIQWLQCSVMPSGVPRQPCFLGLVLSNYLVEQMERQAVHHFVVCAMHAPEPQPRLLVWVFQPLIALAIPASFERVCDACKVLYQPCTQFPAMPNIPLILPAEACDALAHALHESACIYPPTRRMLGEWHVGWLPRRWI